MLRDWEQLPGYMQTREVRPYYERLQKKKKSLTLKRLFDIAASLFLITLLFPVFLALAVVIPLDSEGGVFFRQERITQYGRKFKIWKFRTMTVDAEKAGPKVTLSGDMRVTRAGRTLRNWRLDELPQLVNVLLGDMSFVGTRPEVEQYVRQYTPEMMATLLLPAGITSEASIRYKDEDRLLREADSVETVYVEKILPGKMKYNLREIKKFSLSRELKTMARTIILIGR